MAGSNYQLLLIFDAVFLYLIVFSVHFLRDKITLGPFYGLLGLITAVMWIGPAGSSMIEVFGLNLIVGGVVFYNSLTIGIFIIYLFDGPAATRIAIAIIAFFSLLVPTITWIINNHLSLMIEGFSPLVATPEFRSVLSSLCSFVTSSVALTIIWELTNRKISSNNFFFRIFLTLILTMWIDSCVYAIIAFYDKPFFIPLVKGNFISRSILALSISPIIWLYLIFQRKKYNIKLSHRSIFSVFITSDKLEKKLSEAKAEIKYRTKLQTELRKSQKAAIESKNFLEKTLSSLSEAVVVIDSKNGTILLCNSAVKTIFGYDPNELIGQSTEILHVDRSSFGKFGEIGSPALEKDGIFRTEFKMKKKDGSIIETENTVTTIWDNEGWISGFVGVARDITKRKLLETDLISSRENLRQLARHLQKLREEDRKSIAREIHDDVGQTLTALKMDLGWVSKRIAKDQYKANQKIEDMKHLITKSVQSIKRLCSELRPGILDDLGLKSALNWYTSQFAERFAILCHLDVDSIEMTIDKELSTSIYRIVQESLTNISRHAKAKNVWISLVTEGEKLVLTIQDDGTGIDTNRVEGEGSYGIIGMRERAASHNGQFEISRRQEQGTVIHVIFPTRPEIATPIERSS